MAVPYIQMSFRVQNFFRFSWCSLKGYGLLQSESRHLSRSPNPCSDVLSLCPSVEGIFWLSIYSCSKRAWHFPPLYFCLFRFKWLGGHPTFPRSFSSYHSPWNMWGFFFWFCDISSLSSFQAGSCQTVKTDCLSVLNNVMWWDRFPSNPVLAVPLDEKSLDIIQLL